mgnify:CR=1 FL=1
MRGPWRPLEVHGKEPVGRLNVDLQRSGASPALPNQATTDQWRHSSLRLAVSTTAENFSSLLQIPRGVAAADATAP